VDLTVILTDDQLEVIGHRVAEILRGDASQADAQADDRDLLRVADAARLAGLSPKTIANYLSEGRLTRYGQPRVPMVSRAELLAMIGRKARTAGWHGYTR